MNLGYHQYIDLDSKPGQSTFTLPLNRLSKASIVSNSSLPKINTNATTLRKDMSSVPSSLHRTSSSTPPLPSSHPPRHTQPEPLTAHNKEKFDGLYRPRSTSDMTAAILRPSLHDLQVRPHSALVYRTQAYSDFEPEVDYAAPTVPFIDVQAAQPYTYTTTNHERRGKTHSPLSPPQITTNGLANTGMSPSHPYVDATPRAQSRNEMDSFVEQPRKRRSGGSHTSSLHGIPEDSVADSSGTTLGGAGVGTGAGSRLEYFDSEEELMKMENPANSSLRPDGDSTASSEEIQALQHAFEETWTLCNTLAMLSSKHRQRIFQQKSNNGSNGGYRPRGSEKNEEAWKLCWKLCFLLYRQREQHHSSSGSSLQDRGAAGVPVQPILDGCRAFCQSLFDLRQRDDLNDGVLRVSFELNNHLYNSQDRSLPIEFRERTLQFYITLCHRLMKQRSSSHDETDALLRASWNLAENLFTLRENRREGRSADEDLLGSAVQSTLEMCDVFREGWTRVRPERHTPRPVSTSQFAGMPPSGSVRAGVPAAVVGGPGSVAGSRGSTLVNASGHDRDRDRDRERPLQHPRANGHAPVPQTHAQAQAQIHRLGQHGGGSGAHAPGTPTTIFDELPMSPEAAPRMRQMIIMDGAGSQSGRGSAHRLGGSGMNGRARTRSRERVRERSGSGYGAGSGMGGGRRGSGEGGDGGLY